MKTARESDVFGRDLKDGRVPVPAVAAGTSDQRALGSLIPAFDVHLPVLPR
jgi:hypothetical protein